jgi:two-component system response regulator AgrA
MIPIYICEDQSYMLKEIYKEIEHYCLFHELDFQIQLATVDPDELLDDLSRRKQIGIYFLDVDLGKDKINGFELGKKIRELDPRGFIIYITTHEELLAETFRYRLEALDYIAKEDSNEMIQSIQSSLEQINRLLMQDQRKERSHLAVERAGNTTYIPLEKILYLETSSKKHVVNLITTEGSLEFYGSLSDMEKTLDSKQFRRVHRAFLVNTSHIIGFDKKNKTLLLTHKKDCFIARNKMKEVETMLRGRV